MTALTWNDAGERVYELGCDRGVFYPPNDYGVAWNGLLGVSEKVSGGAAKPFFMDGVKYLNRASPTDHALTLEALTYPDEFAPFDGSPEEDGLTFGHQRRSSFDLSYRTLLANDLEGQDYGYKIHLIYNALASPSAKAMKSLGSTAEPTPMSWDLSTTPIAVPGRRPTAYFSIKSRSLHPTMLKIVEEILYGSDDYPPRMPSPAEWINILSMGYIPDSPGYFARDFGRNF